MEVTINNQTITVPQSWNELSLEQQLFCYGVIMSESGDMLEPQELLPAKKLAILQYLLQLDEAFIKAWREDVVEGDIEKEDADAVFYGEVDELMACTEFLFEPSDPIEAEEEDQPLRYQLKLDLTENPFPFFHFEKKNGKKKYYHGPADELTNISIYEMGMAFTVFETFMETFEEDLAHELIAILWRPSKPQTKENKQKAYEGDRRQPLLHYEATIARRKERMATLPTNVKQLILFWFASCRQQIIAQYPEVFTSGDAKRRKGRDFGWGGLLMSLAGGLQNLDAISQQPHDNALTYLAYLEDQRQQVEARQPAY